MQLVGVRCETCDKNILTAASGVGCRSCSLPFHRDCLSNPDQCPRCGQSFSAQEARESADRERLRRRGQRRTGLLQVLGGAGLLGLGLVGIFGGAAINGQVRIGWLLLLAISLVTAGDGGRRLILGRD